jgi:glycosyltransferase involved in cell wall biosynthesis
MAAGTPVITGLAPATLELGKDAVARIDPADPVGSIASLLQRMQIDSEWRTQLRAAGLRRARAYSWSKSAERYLAVYESVLSCA